MVTRLALFASVVFLSGCAHQPDSFSKTEADEVREHFQGALSRPVKEAQRGDKESLHKLFALCYHKLMIPEMNGEGVEGASLQLTGLLHELGDLAFADALRTSDLKTRAAVAYFLQDEDHANLYPETYVLLKEGLKVRWPVDDAVEKSGGTVTRFQSYDSNSFTKSKR